MLSSCSSGSPSTMNCRRRSSVTHWKAAVSFSSCSCKGKSLLSPLAKALAGRQHAKHLSNSKEL